MRWHSKSRSTPEHAGHHGHDAGDAGPVAHLERPGSPEDGEDHEPQGIERQEQLAKVAHQRGRDDPGHGGARHQQHVFGVLDPEQGIVAQQHIPNGTATDGRRRGDDHDAKQIHPSPTRSQRASHPFGHQAEQEECM